MTKCVICDTRPAQDGGYCANCQAKIESDKNKRKADKPFRYLLYRDNVVGLYRRGDGKLTPRLCGRSPQYLPKSKTIDLDHYCQGYSREVIKAFKACVLSVVNA